MIINDETIEYRSLGDIFIRAIPAENVDNEEEVKESRVIAGYALKFNSLSEDLGGYKEIIDPSSITNEFLKTQKVLACIDHSPLKVLAKYDMGVGTLTLGVDEIGVFYELSAPKNSIGDELIESLLRGDITKSSFKFSILNDGYEWIKMDGVDVRKIIKFHGIYDVSPVYFPAYNNTNSQIKRSLDQFNKEQEKLINAEKRADQYKKITDIINDTFRIKR